MKSLKILFTAIVLGIFTTSMTSVAQTAELTVVIKGVKEVKGNIMIAAGDRANPQEMISDMIKIVNTDDIICVLKDIPVGKTNLYVFQDINENFQLDTDEKRIPIEPCYTKEKITIKEGENRVEVKLLNIKEMMGGN
jgi:Uncharacterized protein conserved in bacteria